MQQRDIPFKEVTYKGDTFATDIEAAMVRDKRNVVLPTSASLDAVNKIKAPLRMLSELKEEEKEPYMVNLFGYPEWQTYTNDHLASFYELDTYFYASFYTNNLFPEAVQFSSAYRKWYSKDMLNSFPKYGMLGFDTGYFFLKGLSQYGNKLEDKLDKVAVTPIQTGFKFERVNNWGGFINRKVFFVHFTKDFELIKLDFE